MIPKPLKLKPGDTIFLSVRWRRCDRVGRRGLSLRSHGKVFRYPHSRDQDDGTGTQGQCPEIRDPPAARRPQDQELFRILAAKSGKKVTGGNWAERCKEIERRINTGSCLELGEVVRDLTRWKKTTGLSFEESLLLETACGYLARELAAIENISPQMARDRIQGHIIGTVG